MTARTLASRAHVSPNTIYYHFDCIFDVARCAVEEELSSELALFLITPEWKDSSALASLLSDPSNAKRFERIRLVAASENAQLTTLLTEAVKGKWLDAVGVDEESLSVEPVARLALHIQGCDRPSGIIGIRKRPCSSSNLLRSPTRNGRARDAYELDARRPCLIVKHFVLRQNSPILNLAPRV